MSGSVTVRARFTKNGEAEDRECRLEYDGKVVQLRGGPTGYESFYWSDHSGDAWQKDWVANFGSGTYAHCVVPAAEMERALRELGAIEPGRAARAVGEMSGQPRRLWVADMAQDERAHAEVMHEFECDEQPPGHPMTDHEPWTEGDQPDEWDPTSWPRLREALNRHGWHFEAEAGKDRRGGQGAADGFPDANDQRWYIEARVGGDNYRDNLVHFIWDRRSGPLPDGASEYVNQPAEEYVRRWVAALAAAPQAAPADGALREALERAVRKSLSDFIGRNQTRHRKPYVRVYELIRWLDYLQVTVGDAALAAADAAPERTLPSVEWPSPDDESAVSQLAEAIFNTSDNIRQWSSLPIEYREVRVEAARNVLAALRAEAKE